ncbi:MAG: 3-oxoacyl-[acyl-carrier-protein] reductase [Bilifractor sp.]|jgi:3-oxoacyl-[acyl-carrier protein] reductase
MNHNEKEIVRTALVTGGGRGIGRAVSEALASLCGNLCINYNGSAASAEETAERCREINPDIRVITVKADVSRSDEADELVKKTTDEFGRIDILVNNAGITRDGLMMRMTDEDFDRVIGVNLKGAFNCSRAAVKKMIRQRYGRIINFSSVTGVHGNAGQVNYAASKAGIIGMTKSMAKELAGRNITVNAVAPGLILTDMTAVLPEEAKKAIVDQIPMKKAGTPQDVAAAVKFFASEEAGYFTGQILCPDGGMGM